MAAEVKVMKKQRDERKTTARNRANSIARSQRWDLDVKSTEEEREETKGKDR